jgi:hypothetical protein
MTSDDGKVIIRVVPLPRAVLQDQDILHLMGGDLIIRYSVSPDIRFLCPRLMLSR